ncbi:MAG: hypothetical protein HYR96_11250 [Deltaproteobacteria bacterium]|nr:hypothetical protein [Deltaproteobacteria bacterium]MBI3293293.1 hypothetical protein [Deltaproteobacteria bacterium]
MKKNTIILAATGLIFSLSGCSFDDGTTVNVKTSLVSTTLASADGTRGLETSGCGGSYVACITPDSVTGKAYYAGMIVGTSNGLSLGPMIGSVRDPSTATAFADSDLQAFDFSQQLAITGSPTLGGPIPYPADSLAYITQFHVYFGFVDTKLTLGSSEGHSFAGIHMIRQVMADITGTDFKKGDLLYHSGATGDFMWCVDGSGCSSSTRPTTPISNSTIASYSSTDPGNKTIPSFFMSPTSSTIQVKKSDLTNPANTNTFKVDITMTNGIKFTTAASSWSSIDKMVAAFRLPASPGDSNSGFSAAITYTP